MTFDLFVLGGDTFFTVYICFKETLFFNFSYKLLKYYLCFYYKIVKNYYRFFWKGLCFN